MEEPHSVSDELSLLNQAARKKELISELRALVKSPGWAYLCTVVEQQRLTVLLNLSEAATQDELLRVNADLREVRTYSYLISLPQNIISEFEASLENPDDHQ